MTDHPVAASGLCHPWIVDAYEFRIRRLEHQRDKARAEVVRLKSGRRVLLRVIARLMLEEAA